MCNGLDGMVCEYPCFVSCKYLSPAGLLLFLFYDMDDELRVFASEAMDLMR
jgi:hypothetical protein